MTTTSPTVPDTNLAIVDSFRRREALRHIAPELKELEAERVVTISIDIPSAVIGVLGRIREISAFGEEVSKLPGFDFARFEKLETYALAAAQAHTEYVIALEPSEPIQELNEELTKVRDILIADITALSKRKLIDAAPLQELRGSHGYKNLTFDIFTMCGMLRNHWAQVSGKTGVTLSELDRAENLADRLEAAVGEKEQGPARVSAVSDTRQRAFSMLHHVYDQARRAITYLRWDQDDVDALAPSLYAGRGVRKTDNKPAPTPTPAPAPAPATPTTPANPAPTASTEPSVSTAPGMPGNPPFGR